MTMIIKMKTFFSCLEANKEENEKVPYLVIIGISCGGVFVLSLFSICLIRYCKRQKKLKRRTAASDGMPAEAALRKQEKYELQESEAKEGIIHNEKSGFSNVASRCQEMGIINDAADHDYQ